ncbi:adenylate/guanylate cyclase domain-containing protein [Paenibacillus oenotherae]|uniref:Adenylate/guanylate cyclase domain-containing protein n=1 Tax=Paenibacillus oenotherae TaxID=1435645 RepID=A0ABS7D1P8_9BACL|nr:adenylate/guanylate cyclase domain-containing protein [Paenibacillus oenotherae]MBW7473864.1 adenylate/guanylate cyclase domain-containing protein [Paenibacillus oenotherae]
MVVKKGISKVVKSPAINTKVSQLEEYKQLIQKVEEDADKVVQEIRSGFQDVVIVFIDLVDSTRFKVQFRDEPEQWILRLMQFSNFLSQLIESLNGKVVKYIGDEVMAIFDHPSKVNDALNLVIRIDEIQEALTEITGHDTKVKISIDKGPVYLVEYSGHKELDPQGTAVDRCARISKYALPGTVITSFEYQKFIGKRAVTFELGDANLKGLGQTSLYQLFEQSISIEEKIEVSRNDYDKLCKELDAIHAENSELLLMNQNLQSELKTAGIEPSSENLLPSEVSDYGLDWNNDIQPAISELQRIIKKSGVSKSEYGRFLFLYFKSNDGQKYNAYEGKTFDSSIESNLVTNLQDNNNYYILNENNKLNRLALEAMDELEGLLQKWSEEQPGDEDFEEYDCSLNEPKFWREWLEINVLT